MRRLILYSLMLVAAAPVWADNQGTNGNQRPVPAAPATDPNARADARNDRLFDFKKGVRDTDNRLAAEGAQLEQNYRDAVAGLQTILEERRAVTTKAEDARKKYNKAREFFIGAKAPRTADQLDVTHLFARAAESNLAAIPLPQPQVGKLKSSLWAEALKQVNVATRYNTYAGPTETFGACDPKDPAKCYREYKQQLTERFGSRFQNATNLETLGDNLGRTLTTMASCYPKTDQIAPAPAAGQQPVLRGEAFGWDPSQFMAVTGLQREGASKIRLKCPSGSTAAEPELTL